MGKGNNAECQGVHLKSRAFTILDERCDGELYRSAVVLDRRNVRMQNGSAKALKFPTQIPI